MRSDTPQKAPRGRPPFPVLIALTLAAVGLHGCLLDGVPVDASELPVHAFQGVSTVQVRSLAPPSIESSVTPERAAEPPPAAGDLPPEPSQTGARVGRVAAPEPLHVAAVEAAHLAEAPREPAAAEPTALPSAIEPPPSALTSDSAPRAASPDALASASAPAAAASEPVVLRQPDHSVPVYRTQIPPAATLEYDIRRGSISGTGELSWRPDGGHYEARLNASVIGYTLLTQISQGGFDKAGLAPLRFTDQRARKAARAANFQRDAGKITFSGPSDEFALPAGSQDRLSWMIQLPAVLSAEPKRAVTGGEVVLYVAGARADVSIWTLRCIGVESVETASGAVRTVKFMRSPRGPKDTQAEVWLDPTRHYMPVRARLTQAGDEADAFELVLRHLKVGP